ncbi:MAG: NADH-quinone oxidoreductase subunit M [Pseudomonadota bacterium]
MFPILSTLIWLPIISGALLLTGMRWLTPQVARVITAAVVVISFGVLFQAYMQFDPNLAAPQFQELKQWIPQFQVHYQLGIDGFSLGLIALTCLCLPLVILSSWHAIAEQRQYLAAFLLLQGAMIGVFSALDGLLFYVFWEALLIPMFLIIGIWGGANRRYATLKFFLYTFFGSIFLLVALLYLYQQAVAQQLSLPFSIATFQAVTLSVNAQIALFLGMLIAFAVKVPMWPVHTWLPDAHVEAPTGGSVVLAAIMLKLGGYGLLRFVLPIAPDAARILAWPMIILSLIAVVYIGLVAIVQSDMKKLIAYSSIAHMGFVTLGCFAAPVLLLGHHPALATWAIQGAYVQMISHGFISAALFLCVGVLYERMHSREIADYGGVAQSMPVFSALFVFFAMANSGLPGTSGFVGEFLVILGVFAFSKTAAALAALTLIFGAAYSLWMVKRVFFGEVTNPVVATLSDIDGRERSYLYLLALLVLFFGLYPKPLVDLNAQSVATLLSQTAHSKLPKL